MAITRNPFERVEQARNHLRGVRGRWREAVGLPPEEEEPVPIAPPVQQERPWNIPNEGVMVDRWWDMQRAMMADIEAGFPEPPPIRQNIPNIAQEVGWAPWVPRAVHIAEADNMQGKKYGEDYS